MSAAITALIAAIAAIISPLAQEYLRRKHEKKIKTMEFLQNTMYSCFQEFSDCYSAFLVDHTDPDARRKMLSSAYRLASMIDDPKIRSEIYSASDFALYEVAGVTPDDYSSKFKQTMKEIAEHISKTQG